MVHPRPQAAPELADLGAIEAPPPSHGGTRLEPSASTGLWQRPVRSSEFRVGQGLFHQSVGGLGCLHVRAFNYPQTPHIGVPRAFNVAHIHFT